MKPSAEETSASGNAFARRQEIATSHWTPMSCILPTRNIVSRLVLMKHHIGLATLGRVEARGDITSAARLYHKYDMAEILDKATKPMHPLFPDTFTEWDKNGPLSPRPCPSPRASCRSAEHAR